MTPGEYIASETEAIQKIAAKATGRLCLAMARRKMGLVAAKFAAELLKTASDKAARLVEYMERIKETG